ALRPTASTDSWPLLSEGKSAAFHRRLDDQPGGHPAGVLARVGEQVVHRDVVVLRLVMKQHEPGAAGGCRETHGLPRGGMSPARALLNELIRVHRVVNQRVGAGQELHQARTPVLGYRICATGA